RHERQHVMDKKAWIHQLKKQVEQRGEEKASWYISWRDPAGVLRCKSCGPGKVGKSAASKLADTIHSQLVTGTYQGKQRATWEQFFVRYKAHVDGRYDAPSREAALRSIRTFARIAKPKLFKSIDTAMIDQFIGTRLKEVSANTLRDGKQRMVSPATVNRELRYVKSALRLAVDWGFTERVPRIRFLKPLQKLPTFVSPEQFSAMFHACEVATMPHDLPNVSPTEWWRGLLLLLYMTGWRIGQTMKLKIDDINFEQGTALNRAGTNKGRRDQLIPLHPLVIQHLKPLARTFNPLVFPWNYNRRTLWTEFAHIQKAARLADGSQLPMGGKDGRWFGFHDLRRGFATVNAASMDLFELQALMQHQTLATTQGYVSMANRLQKPVSNLFVPSLSKKGETA
ncbi:MAG: tyrosine-type recombinase/integrase, partial [Planctomycetia bacterium]|nr:tyrosine-type recombinase/integrase [Planctomycetia bacterium]